MKTKDLKLKKWNEGKKDWEPMDDFWLWLRSLGQKNVKKN